MKFAVAAVLLALAAPAAPPPPLTALHPAVAQDADDPFAGPWAEEALERAVRGPREALDKGNLAIAEERLRRLLDAAAEDPAERVRLMTAWAIALMVHHSGKGDPLPWLRLAAREAGAAWPADSRLRAMALGDYGTFEVERLGAETSPEAEAALVEALDIRRRRLGPGHVETLSATVALGQLRGHPGRTQGDPERIAAAAAFFEPLLTADAVADEDSLDPFFLAWTGMLIANGRPDAACAVLQKLPPLERRLNLSLDFIAHQTGLKLRDAGYAGHAAGLIPGDPFLETKPARRLQCGT